MKKVLFTFTLIAMFAVVGTVFGANNTTTEDIFNMALRGELPDPSGLSARGPEARVDPVEIKGKDSETGKEVSIPVTSKTLFVKVWFVNEKGKPFNPLTHRFNAKEYFEIYVCSSHSIQFQMIQNYPQHQDMKDKIVYPSSKFPESYKIIPAGKPYKLRTGFQMDSNLENEHLSFIAFKSGPDKSQAKKKSDKKSDKKPATEPDKKPSKQSQNIKTENVAGNMNITGEVIHVQANSEPATSSRCDPTVLRSNTIPKQVKKQNKTVNENVKFSDDIAVIFVSETGNTGYRSLKFIK